MLFCKKIQVTCICLFFVLSSSFADNDTLPVLRQVFSKIISQDHEITDKGGRIEKAKMDAVDYIPAINGTVRARYEYCPQLDAGRFQVRNARFSLTGNVHPFVAYKAEIDLSDRGTIRMLDAYVRVLPVYGLALTLGQMKVRFSTDNLRSPHNQYFSNRAFIAKQASGFRDVGFTIGYNLKKYFPFEVIAGVYNGSGLTGQREWQKKMDYSVRTVFSPVKQFSFNFDWLSVNPEKMRMNIFDVGVMSDFYGVHLEAEGLYKVYEKNLFVPSYGVTCFAAYDLLLPKVFHKIRFLARYDMLSDNNRGYASEAVGSEEIRRYEVDDVFRHRVTAGITVSVAKPVLAELRVNYEKYFYYDRSLADPSEQDKLVVELVARF